MLDIIFEEDFHKDMKDLDKTIRKEIQNHLLKIRVEGILRKHFHYGLPYFIERVGYSCRIIYQINDNKIYILRFLKSHKEYEKWYKK